VSAASLVKEQVAQIKEALSKGACVVLVGRAGTGKTTALYAAAQELGYRVWTVDPLTDELDRVRVRLRSKPLVPLILHVTSADAVPLGRVRALVEAARECGVPVAVESVAPVEVEGCATVQFFKPRARDVARLVEELGLQYGAVRMYDDIRQVLLSQYGTMGYEEEVSATKRAERGLRSGKYEDVDDTVLSLLLDSAHLNFYGRDLYLFVKAVQAADRCRRGSPLSGFRVVKPVVVSYFLEKLKLVRKA